MKKIFVQHLSIIPILAFSLLTACQGSAGLQPLNSSAQVVSAAQELQPGAVTQALRPGSKALIQEGNLVALPLQEIRPGSKDSLQHTESGGGEIRPGSKGDRVLPVTQETVLSGTLELTQETAALWLPQSGDFIVQSLSESPWAATLDNQRVPIQVLEIQSDPLQPLVRVRFRLFVAQPGENMILALNVPETGLTLKTWVPSLLSGPSQELTEPLNLKSTAKVLLFEQYVAFGGQRSEWLNPSRWKALDQAAEVLLLESTMKQVLKDKRNLGKKTETLTEVMNLLNRVGPNSRTVPVNNSNNSNNSSSKGKTPSI